MKRCECVKVRSCEDVKVKSRQREKMCDDVQI